MVIKNDKNLVANCYYTLAECYYNGWNVEKDLIKAAEFYRKAAQYGNSAAANKLGNWAYNLKPDYAKAYDWYVKAGNEEQMEEPSASALYMQGLYSEYGWSPVQKDIEKAQEYYQKAAELGDSRAKNVLKKKWRFTLKKIFEFE